MKTVTFGAVLLDGGGPASLVIRGDMIFEPEPKRVDWGSAEFLIGS